MRLRRPLRYHVLHWLDALTWPASLIFKTVALAVRGVRRLWQRVAVQ